MLQALADAASKSGDVSSVRASLLLSFLPKGSLTESVLGRNGNVWFKCTTSSQH